MLNMDDKVNWEKKKGHFPATIVLKKFIWDLSKISAGADRVHLTFDK